VNQAATDGITAIKMIQPETKVKPAARENLSSAVASLS
jgi:hypothetical protein